MDKIHQKEINFSVNTNSMGISDKVYKNLHRLTNLVENYPDNDCKTLRKELAKKYNIPENTLLVGNGADDLIYRLMFAFQPKKAVIVEPTYEAYERALKLVDCHINHYQLSSEKGFNMGLDIMDFLKNEIDMLILCNPNNPTGNLLEGEVLNRIIETCKEKDILLVIDESFIEFYPEWNKLSCKRVASKDSNIIVIDSFTKTYCLAGFRLGFCVSANGELFDKMYRFGQSHGVSIPAQFAGIWSLEDEHYLLRTYDYLLPERNWLFTQIKDLGVDVWPSQGNFLLLRFDESNVICKLSNNGFKTRDCTQFYGLNKNYTRISIRTHEENQALVSMIKSLLN